MRTSFRIERWHSNLAAIWIAQLVSSIGFSFIFPFIPLYIQDLGVHDPTAAAQWAGLIGAASALSMTVVQPIWGNLADRFGRKPMVVRAMVGGGIIISLMSLATTPEHLLVLRFIQGSITGVVAAATALVSTGTPKHRLGLALGLLQVALFVGSSVGPLIGGIIADTYGFRAAFYSAGILLLLSGAVVILFCHEEFVRPPADERREGILAGSRSLLALSPFPILIVVSFLIQLGGVVVSPVLALFIVDLSGSPNAATAAGTVLAATGAASAVSAVLIGRVSDRVGHSVVLPVCLLGAALAYYPQAMVQSVGQLLVLRMLLGVFIGGLMPSANALVANLVPKERRGAAFGLTATANSLANLVGPLAGAGITTQWGMRAVFLATGALFTLGLGWTVLGFRRMGALRPMASAEGVEATPADGDPSRTV